MIPPSGERNNLYQSIRKIGSFWCETSIVQRLFSAGLEHVDVIACCVGEFGSILDILELLRALLRN